MREYYITDKVKNLNTVERDRRADDVIERMQRDRQVAEITNNFFEQVGKLADNSMIEFSKEVQKLKQVTQ